ncbi:MAG: DUF6265 family protein [Litorimonas sp.]
MTFPRAFLFAIAALLFVGGAGATEQSDNIEVRFAQTGQVPPQATLDGIAWFEGLWVGTVFGGPVEHRVMPPKNGHMPGLVRLTSGETGEVFLYELSSFSEVDGTLSYRNRLFGPDLGTAGEDEQVMDRTLVALEDGTAYFDGITFAPDGPDRALVAFVLPDGEGNPTRHVVSYSRRGADAP